MVINDDKDNEFTRAIIGMAQKQIKRGNVEGIYIQSYQNRKRDNQIEVELTTIIDEVTLNWQDEIFWDGDSRYIKVRNMRVTNNIEIGYNFSSICMHVREAKLEKKKKNAKIIYDKVGKLKGYKEIYDEDNNIPLYINRIEISPKLIKKIRTGISYKKEVKIPNTTTTHYVNPLAMGTDDKITQIKNLLYRYHYESGDQ